MYSEIEFTVDNNLKDKSKLESITYISIGGVKVTYWRKKRRRYSMLNVQGRKPVNGWVGGMLKEFRLTKDGKNILAIFMVDGQGNNTASTLIGNPVELKKLNNIRKACNLSLISDPNQIELPTVDDMDMLGYDVAISLKIKQNGDYMNVEDVRPGNTVTTSDFASLKED